LSRGSALNNNGLGVALGGCGGLNRHNFLNNCSNGTNEVSIGIYVKCKL
jgi:hypothetical protein